MGNLVRFVFQHPMNPEKLAFAVQRLTGLGILLYLMMHVFVTGTVAGGREIWEGMMRLLANPMADVGKLLLFVGANFHGVNGIRVLLLELTPLAGRPARPDYPYRIQSLGTGQKSILYLALVMAGLSAIAGILVLWGI
jgi:succinate dehydrogenase / fumarate reductase cytochrome b subunit